jgi:AraC-like DNA-binding protein
MEPILHTQIEQLISLAHQIMVINSAEGKTEIVGIILFRIVKLLSMKELSMVSRFLSAFNELLSGFIPEEKYLFKQDKRIQRVLEFIEKNYNNPVKLPDVARHVGLSESALSRLFRKQTAKTFIEYLNDVRIEHSVNLLREMDDLVSPGLPTRELFCPVIFCLELSGNHIRQ